jgi:CheY-like chemotaxis protein
MDMSCKILIGEDDFEDQFILEEYFQDNGVKEVVAFEKNGKKIIEYLEQLNPEEELPSLIVLDLNMPILNGTQTLFELKQHARFNKIPVIIYSTSDNDHEKRKCINFGAVEYLVKPISVEEGDRMVKRFLQFVDGYN